MSEDKSYYEDLRPFALSEADRDAVLSVQTECTFCWGTKDGSPMGVIMGYVWHDGKDLAHGHAPAPAHPLPCAVIRAAPSS